MTDAPETPEGLTTLTVDIVVAHVSNNPVTIAELPALIAGIHGALHALGAPKPEAEKRLEPAVSIRSSVKPDHIVCLEDGKKLKLLKRYLMTRYQLTPEQYRARWGLPADYPMIAPNYSETRRALAHTIGLGRKPAAGDAEPAAQAAREEKTTRTRRKLLGVRAPE